ncbi:cupin domain-containing protein [Corynebacterium poyangense]|uniref:Cupin domain-containing protein n=1 Tax=Corynebacterium poyangense TaxID=2684405 RepID=A0A7H0SLP2_9CORY|nr:carboxymuconolactone decarboxylase family protein [Corynebacterium poyangense]MBZ8177573.1 cupin domain-containing protein [Corynebacterium poyangense]QNQ89467.1 cupin domain-containing protein [Corynebacterium poyangense]
MEKIIQTTGHDVLGSFAPSFAHYNDDVLFGENWNDPALTHKQRCLLTVAALVSSGVTDSSLSYHLRNAKQSGINHTEIAGALTHIAFYVGWPKAWAAFHQAKEVWGPDSNPDNAMHAHAANMLFPIGEPNNEFSKYFSGKSYLANICSGPLPIFNVTFEPGCKNNWHIHHADQGGGQVLICVAGQGLYQAWGEEPIGLAPGDAVIIPAGVKHWHGATDDRWFSHLAIEIPGENSHTEWLEPIEENPIR